MSHNFARMFTLAASFALASCSGNAEPVDQSDTDASVDTSPGGIASNLEGHWSGSWGGGAQGDVVFQPVLAELVIEGDHVELSGFPDASELTGTIHYDGDTRRIVITSADAESGEAAPLSLEYTYDVSGDELTLTGRDERSVSLLRRRLVHGATEQEGPPVP